MIVFFYLDFEVIMIGCIIVFMGIKGGVGVSMFVYNVGWFLVEKFEEGIVVMDLDLLFGIVSLNFN